MYRFSVLVSKIQVPYRARFSWEHMAAYSPREGYESLADDYHIMVFIQKRPGHNESQTAKQDDLQFNLPPLDVLD